MGSRGRRAGGAGGDGHRAPVRQQSGASVRAHAKDVAVADSDTLYAQAFILTRGKTHYRTLDRGKSWQRFDMPLTPALIGRPLSFHSDPSKWGYILYQGTACDSNGGWGDSCHDEVSFVSAPVSSHCIRPPYLWSEYPSLSSLGLSVRATICHAELLRRWAV